MKNDRRTLLLCSLAWPLLLATAYAKEPTEGHPPFHIQAHRGAGVAFPENTLESFRWSWDHQVTPEADLRTTKDGAIVCFHDDTFKRVVRDAGAAGAGGAIEKSSLADVQLFDVGSFRGEQFAGQRIPTLASVFEEMRGHPVRLLYIDVKTAELDALAQLVKEHGVERQVIFTTMHHRLIRDWKKRVPKSMTLLWNGGGEEAFIKKLNKVRKTNFEGITHLQIHVEVGDRASVELFMPSSNFLKALDEELAQRGIIFQVLPWECSDQRVYEVLLALGVDSFATDYPKVTLAAVRRFREKQQPRVAK